ncbi:MAG TPA: aldehyde dehydrogenase family protein [Actinomycetota bacterium]|nr:aldehyde dehydrogenase family protein [Actinomycetota bacterium]
MPTTLEVLPEVEKFLQEPKSNLIGGEWVQSASGKTFQTIDPGNGEVLTEVPETGTEDIDRAVAVARELVDKGKWSSMRPAERGAILWKIADLVEANKMELAQLEVLDQGKPMFMAMAEMDLVASTFRYFAGWVDKYYGETNQTDGSMFVYSLREAVGVTAGIIPWNYPLIMLGYKVAPALAFGNTMILKPAEQTPLTALRFGELALEAGLPAGVLQIVTGAAETGKALVAHPGIDKIAFTGSTDVGRQIMKSAADTLKRVTLELGGKSPNIVFADAELKPASSFSMYGVFLNSGQTCTAATRLLVEKSIHDEFVEAVSKAADKMSLGHGLSSDTRMGPVVSQEQLDRVMDYIEVGTKEGATVVAGGERADGDLANGFFVKPTIFTGVKPEMRIAREEIFGPVLAVTPVEDVEEAIALGNSSEYGLAAAVWTKDLKKAHRVAAGLKAGTVWVNTYGLYDPAVSFGGYKQSGFGRELGKHAIEAYTQTKSVWLNLS